MSKSTQTNGRSTLNTATRAMQLARGSTIPETLPKKRPIAAVLVAVLAAALLGAGIPAAYALPTGGQVAAGSATITQPNAVTLQITQGTQNAILNWQSFSIAAPESVLFQQPSAAAIALNRVLGNNPSEIFGRLSANGQIFLVNPNGILFGRTASIDVGGIAATTLNIEDSDFLAGNYVFSRGAAAGSVVNHGAIFAPGGYVALIAPNVANEGVISARLGSVALAAGNQVTLDMIGDGLIKVRVDEAALRASVINRGTIEADGGNVLLTARSADALLDTVINVEGVIRANTLVERGGSIYLDGGSAGVTSVSGTLQASGTGAGEKGGTVTVLGNYVGLFGNASINASGDAGGGTVLIGGNFQGRGSEANAFRTYVGKDAAINANAITSGNGGRVIVWADDVTRFYGSISARGGALSGDGGFAEVSGKESLVFRGLADLRADNGVAGTLLLDPKNIVVSIGNPGGATSRILASELNEFGDNPSETSWITPAQLDVLLLAASVLFQANNDITVDDVISLPGSGTSSLTFQAGRSILINANISLRGAFTATANDPGAIAANRDPGPAAFTMAPGTTINTTTNNNNITITMSTGPGGGALSGDITLASLNAGTGHVLVAQNGATAGSDILRADAASLITATSATLDVSASSGGSVGIAASPIRVTVTNVEARGQGGGVFITSPTAAVNIGGATLPVVGNLTGISTAAGNGIISVTSASAAAITVNEAISANGSGNVTLNAAGLLTANAAISSTTGNLSLTGGTGVTHNLNGDLTTGGIGTIGVTATSGNVAMADGTVYTTGSGTVTVTAATNVVLGQITTTSSAVNVTATAGAITDITALETANITTSGTATLVAATGIGSAGGAADINTAIGTLVATNNTSGNIVVLETDGLIIGGTGVRTLGANGNIDVRTTAGGLAVNSVVTAHGTGTVTLNASGAIGDITSGAGGTITGTAGLVQLTAGRNVTLGAAVTAGTTATIDFGQTAAGVFTANAGITGTSVAINGGANGDTFDFSGATGTITATVAGGGGSDTLRGRNAANAWTITAGNAGNVSSTGTITFSAIANLTGGTGADTFTLAGGTLSGSINGGAGTDTLTGDNVASLWTVTGANSGTATGVTGGFTNIANLVGGTATDGFTLAGGTLSGSINGGGGAGVNTLTGDNVASLWTITGANSGTATGVTGGFSNIENLTGGTSTDSFTLSVGGTLSGTIAGGLGTDTLTGDNVANTWAITGANSGTATGTGGFSGIENLVGGTGADGFTLSGTGNISGTIASGSGNDTLTGQDVVNTWAINGINAGTLTDPNGANVFTGIDNLVGGTGADTFTLSGTGRIGGTIHPGSITGGGGVDTLRGKDTVANTWVINAADAGTLTDGILPNNFTGIDNLVGGTGADGFTLSGTGTLSGTIAGGAGTDTLTGANVANTWAITGANSGTATGTGGFSGIENLVGGTGADGFTLSGTGNISGTIASGSGNDTLTGQDVVNTWAINGINAGTLTDPNGANVFTGIDNLVGGTGADTFTLSGTGRIGGTIHPGSITGGGGVDTLRGKDTVANTWAITGTNAGTLTDGGLTNNFSGITNLTGGTGTDTFTLGAGVSTFAGSIAGGGGPGVNTLASTNTANTWAVTTLGGGGTLNTTTTFSAIQNLTGGNSTDGFTLSGTGNISGTIAGGPGADTLTGQNVVNTWAINGINAGTLTDPNGANVFTGIDNLVGGGLADTFTLSGTGRIDGTITGGGVVTDNTLTGKGITSAWAISAANAGTLTDTHGANVFTGIGALVGGAAADTFTLATDVTTFTGSIAGGGGVDTLASTNTANTWAVTGLGTGTLNATTAFSAIQNLTGGSNTDAFTLTGAGNISGTIAGGAAGDTLTGQDIANTWAINGTNAGTLTNTQGANVFTGIENLVGGAAADTFTVASTIVFGGSIAGGGGVDTLAATDGTNAWAVTGGNIGTLNTNTAFSAIQNLTGGPGEDTFTLTSSGRISGTIAGGLGTDTLTGQNLANTWAINGTNAGTLTDSNGANVFTGIDNLTGGTSTDAFTLSLTGRISGTITGTGTLTDNTLTGNDITSAWAISAANVGTLTDANGANAFTGIGALVGGTAADTFTLAADLLNFAGSIAGGGGAGLNTLASTNTANTWAVTGLDAGTLNGSTTTFSAIQNLTGGTSTDAFTLSATGRISGTIAGGLGLDTLTGQDIANTWAINGTNAGTLTDANGANVFTGIDNLTGGNLADTFTLSGTGRIRGTIAGGTGTNTLTGKDLSSTWAISAANAGTLTDTHGANAFTGIGALVGGAAADTFTLATGIVFSGTIAGGAGTNTLADVDGTNAWAVTGANAGTLNGTAFSAIQNLTGGTDADTFTLSGAGLISGLIAGGLGADTLNIAGIAGAQSVKLTAVAAGTNEFSGTGVGGGFTGISNLTGKTGDTLTGISQPDSFTGFTSYTKDSQTLTISGFSIVVPGP